MAIEIQSQTVNATSAASQQISVSKAGSQNNSHNTSSVKNSSVKNTVNQPSQNAEVAGQVSTTQAVEIQGNASKPLEMPKDSLQDAVNKLQDYVDKYDRDLKFSIDDDTGRTVVTLLDSDKNVLKQYPSEDILKLISNLEQNKGLFIGKA